MNIHFLTPFPKMVDSIIGESILARAQSKGYVNYNIHNLFVDIELGQNLVCVQILLHNFQLKEFQNLNQGW